MSNQGEKEVAKSNNPVSFLEEQVLDFWSKGKIFEKSVKKEAPQGDFVFYDGPPFITGLPHYATLLPSIAKDMVPRYWTMKGYRVERVWGWDCHGLPAENRVEEQLGLRNKKDIEKMGVDKFVQACRNYVSEGSEQWRWYIDRIGRWVDMDNAYRTMDKNFMESVIWAFKKLFEKGLIYEGFRSSLHCPRCATPLSKFEITMDAGSYKDVEDDSVVIKFALKDKKNTYVLAWTTTPWTLPGNLALAVGAKIAYVKVKHEDIFYILAKERLENIFQDKKYEVVEELNGSDLVGLSYEPLFDLENEIYKIDENVYKVYSADFVSTEDGTGIVHIAPNFGEDDFDLGKAVGLPMLELMDENGHYTEAAGDWKGLYFKKANDVAIERLGDKLFSKFKYTHSYPFCYRCKTALIYKAQKAWYLDVNDVREKMLSSNKRINWVPEYFKEGRFQYNIESAPDWCLSRSRYWGSPIPVWRCDACQEIKVLGSIEEIEKASGQTVKDLHKPDIDQITFPCDQCGMDMHRVPEVFDCWFESGAMPFAQMHYPFERADDWEKLFPADFIIEYTGQLRGWFYYLHVLSNALFNDLCYKNVIVTGVLAGTDGRKMSKSFGNYPDPKGTLEKYGADALRVYFMSSSLMLGGDSNFNERDLQDSLRKNIMLLNNVVKFYELFRDENIKAEKIEDLKSDNILDKWILARLQQFIKEVTDNMEAYNLPGATRPITGMIDDLSTWYIRRSRDRFKGEDKADKENALKVTHFVLLNLAKTIAPVMPFIAEQTWQRVTGNNFDNLDRSVHLEEWPLLDEKPETLRRGSGQADDRNILETMVAVRKIVELGLAKRDEAGIKVRQPLASLKIKNQKSKIKDEYIDLIKDEVNVKNVVFVEEESKEGEVSVELDTQITDDLRIEGIKRELVRTINAMRKNAGFTIADTIDIYYQTDGQLIKKAIEKYKSELLNDVLGKEISEGVADDGINELKIENEDIKLKIEKI